MVEHQAKQSLDVLDLWGDLSKAFRTHGPSRVGKDSLEELAAAAPEDGSSWAASTEVGSKQPCTRRQLKQMLRIKKTLVKTAVDRNPLPKTTDGSYGLRYKGPGLSTNALPGHRDDWLDWVWPMEGLLWL